MKPRRYNVVSFFSGSGFKLLGLLRARSCLRSRFRSIGAFDIDPLACQDFELLTGARAQVVDLGEITVEQLAERCDGTPDFVAMSPPCKGFSGCLPEGASKEERYQALNRLALRSVELALETWRPRPKVILLENVPRMRTRGAELLRQIKVILRAADYEVTEQPHDCGEWGGLAQRRERLLLVARHRPSCPSYLMMPPNIGLRPMSAVLWQLPPPLPNSRAGGPHHRLPRLAGTNWLRLATIPAGQDWRAIPERVRIVGDVDPRMGGSTEHRQTGFYGVCDHDDPSHTIIAHARAGNAWASVDDPRLAERAARQNGGYGVNDPSAPSHAVMAEGSVRNTWSSVSDARLGHAARDGGSHGVADCGKPSVCVLGRPGIANGTAAIADPRSGCVRREDSIGVSDPARPYKTPVIGHQKVENSPSSIADHRVLAPRVPEQNRGNFGVQDPARPSACVRGSHRCRTSPAAVADGRLFAPTHELVAGQPWTGDRKAWVAGRFWLHGPALRLAKGGTPEHVIIRAPDGTVHRPMTTAEMMLLQGAPVWHRPRNPAEIGLDDPSGQWVQLAGNDKQVREHVGNAVPVPTATAIGEMILELLDAGTNKIFSLSGSGIWVEPQERGEAFG